MVPSLRMPATILASPDPTKADLYFWLLISLVLCGVWILASFFHTSDHNTSVDALKADALVSTMLSVGLSATAAFLAAKNNLAWALVLPTATAIIDALVTADRAINNAAQKPIVHQRNI